MTLEARPSTGIPFGNLSATAGEIFGVIVSPRYSSAAGFVLPCCREIGIAGVAPNKFLAKLASDWRKPDGLFVIQPDDIDAFLLPLPVGRLPGAMWSLSNAFTSAFKELEPIPQYKATAKLAGFLQAVRPS